MAYFRIGRVEEAIGAFKRVLTRNPDFLPTYLALAMSYMVLGREEESRAEAAEILRLNPQFSLEVARQRLPVKDPAQLEGARISLTMARTRHREGPVRHF
jgi:tetratricopeptide (TPR) repeat protein